MYRKVPKVGTIIINDIEKDVYFYMQKYCTLHKTSCNCICHKHPGSVMHFMACCDNGYINTYIPIPENLIANIKFDKP